MNITRAPSFGSLANNMEPSDTRDVVKGGALVDMKIITFILGGLAAGFLIVALFFTVLIYADSGLIEDGAEMALSTVLGRDTTIGNITIQPGAVTQVRVQDATIKNPEWAQNPNLLSVSDAEIAFPVWPALFGDINFDRIVLGPLQLSLERDLENRQTWDFNKFADAAGSVAAPDERQEFPGIHSLKISDASIHVIDAPRKLDKKLVIRTGEGELRRDQDAAITLNGDLEDAPIEIIFTGGSLQTLRSENVAYPIDLKASFQKTSLMAQGTIQQPFGKQLFDIALEIKGPTFLELFPLIAIPLPDTPPYKISGKLKRGEDFWEVVDLDGIVGDSDLRGKIKLEQIKEPPMLTADLSSKLLDLDDLAGLIGATPDAEETANNAQKNEADASKADGKIFPDTKLQTERLDAMNMDVSLSAERVQSEHLPIDGINARLRLIDRQITVDPLHINMAGGTVDGTVSLDARQEIPTAKSAISFRDIDLKPFFKSTDFVREMGGLFNGRLTLDGRGISFAEIMATATGDAWLGIRDGTMSGLVIEAVGLDIIETLSLVIGEDARVVMPCGLITLKAKSGLINMTEAIFDTSDSVLYAVGNANLNQEYFNVQIEAISKDFSLLDFSAPVSVSGTFDDPSVSIGGIKGLARPQEKDATKDLTKVDCDRLISNDRK